MKFSTKISSLIFFSFLYSTFVFATEGNLQQFVHYNFYVHLNTKKHSLSGDGTVLYKNNSPDTAAYPRKKS